MMINDLFKECPGSVEVSLYADDGALWVVGRDANCCGKIINEAIYSLEQWSHTLDCTYHQRRLLQCYSIGKGNLPSLPFY